MLDLVRVFMGAQGGEALQNFARHYGVGLEEMRRAVEAVTPAFAVALQRAMTDPAQMQRLARILSTPGAWTAVEDANALFGRESTAPSNEAFAALFRNAEAGRAVAEHAAHMTGLARSLFEAMLPPMAVTFVGSLAHAWAGTPLGEAMKAAGLAPVPEPPPSTPKAPGWADMVGGMLGQQRAPKPPPPPPAANPFETWARQFGAAAASPPPPKPMPAKAPAAKMAPPKAQPAAAAPAPPETPPSAATTDWGRAVERLFEVGEDASRAQMESYRDMLERLWAQR